MRRIAVRLIASIFSVGMFIVLTQGPAMAIRPFGAETGPVVSTILCSEPGQSARFPYEFSKNPKGLATYRFGGSCKSPQQPAAYLNYRVEGKWIPSAAPNQHNASESYQITGWERVFPDRRVAGVTSIWVFLAAKCNQDPWLHSANCVSWGAVIPDDVRAAWKQLESGLGNFPWTGRVYSANKKKRLLAEYNQVNGIIPGIATTPKSGLSTTAAYTTAPTIVTPVANGLMVYQKSKFIITPRAEFSGTQFQIEFTRLNAAAGQRRVFLWEPQISRLVQGADIPNDIFGTQAGPWKMRARVVAPKPGDFSLEVPFHYAMQSPVFTTKPQSQFELQRR